MDLTNESQEKMLKKELTFQGKKISLGKLIGLDNLNNLSAEELNNLKEIIDSDTLVKLLSNEQVTIGKELNLGVDYYIQRTLYRQTKIKKKVFEAHTSGKEITNIFAVSDVDKTTLSGLVPKKSEVRLFEENNSNDGNCAPFVVLDKERASEQFQQLCQQYPESNVHWLKSELQNDRFIWQQSQGSLSILRNHRTNYTDVYSEDDLIHQARYSKIVIISDTAGMGKSTILASVSILIKEKSQDVWLIRIDLSDHTDKLQQQKEKDSFNAQDIDRAVNFLAKELLKLSTPFEEAVFQHYRQHGKLIIMFDGFDEISPDYKETVIDLIQALRKESKITELWVTTRPNMQAEVEDKLQQFAYTLNPFSKDEQNKYLTNFWAQIFNLPEDDKKLKIYADTLIKKLTESISDEDKEVTSIPLQTRMLAEVFQNECMDFYNSEQLMPDLTTKFDLIDLYESFLEKKYDIYQVEKTKLNLSRPEIKRQRDESYPQFIDKHESLAFYALFEEEDRRMLLTEKFRQQFSKESPNLTKIILQQPNREEFLCSMCTDKQEKISSFFNIIKEGKEKTGIIDRTNDEEPHFIHRTFAEYLVAKFLVNSTIIQSSLIQNFLIEKILIMSDYEMIRTFFNDQLARDAPLSDETLAQYGALIKKFWQSYEAFCDEVNDLHSERMFYCDNTIIYRAIKENNMTILRFVLASLKGDAEVIELLNSSGMYNKATALHTAIEAGQLEIVKCLVEYGADVNGTVYDPGTISDVNPDTGDSMTALYCAAQKGNCDIVEYLIAKGANVNAKDGYGMTALYCAAGKGNLKMVKILVRKGTDSKDNYGRTVLHYAVHEDHWESVYEETDRTAFDYYPGTDYSIDTQWDDIFQRYWETGKYLAEHSKYHVNATVLQYTTQMDQLKTAEWLVKHGADVNAKDNYDRTVLHYAAHGSGWETVEWLLLKGVEVNAIDKYTMTALHYAAWRCQWKTVELLLKHGAQVDVMNNYNMTALHYAVAGGQKETVALLVGADVNVKDNDDMTALHYAAIVGQWDTVEWLVDRVADINAMISVCTNQITILPYSVRKYLRDLIQYLEKRAEAKDNISVVQQLTQVSDERQSTHASQGYESGEEASGSSCSKKMRFN